MSPLMYYAPAVGGGKNALAQLRALSNLLPKGNVAGAPVNQLLYAANARTCDAVRASNPVVPGMTPADLVVLRRLERGFYYDLNTVLPTLKKLDEAIGNGVAQLTDPATHISLFDPGTRQLGTDETDPAKQVQIIAPFVDIAPEVAANSALFMATTGKGSKALFIATAGRKAIELTVSPPEGFYDRIPPEQEEKIVALQALNIDNKMELDVSLVIPALGLIAAINTTPEVDNQCMADNRLLALWKTIDELDLTMRSWNVLQNANIKYVGQLVQKTEADLLKVRYSGRNALREIKEVLDEMGLKLHMKVAGWPIDGPPPPKPE